MNAEQLNVIKERAAKATAGPWFFGVGRKERLDRRPAVIEHFDYDHGESFIHGDIADITDAEFIAHAREDVPALVAEVERLQESVKGNCKVKDVLARKYRNERSKNERLRKALESINHEIYTDGSMTDILWIVEEALRIGEESNAL